MLMISEILFFLEKSRDFFLYYFECLPKGYNFAIRYDIKEI